MGNALEKQQAGHRPADYDGDFYNWTMAQAELLRGLKWRPAGVDVENLATEIQELGKRDFRSLQSHCSTVLEHMLKTLWATNLEPLAGWTLTVRRHYAEVRMLIEDGSSLAMKLSEKWPDVVHRAVIAAWEPYVLAGDKVERED